MKCSSWSSRSGRSLQPKWLSWSYEMFLMKLVIWGGVPNRTGSHEAMKCSSWISRSRAESPTELAHMKLWNISHEAMQCSWHSGSGAEPPINRTGCNKAVKYSSWSSGFGAEPPNQTGSHKATKCIPWSSGSGGSPPNRLALIKL